MTAVSKEVWKAAQEWERQWHSSCINSLNEELKQLVYAEKMGLVLSPDLKTPYTFDLKDKKILDIGSGPYSLLLKCKNIYKSMVTDPLMHDYPSWVRERYKEHGIQFMGFSGEELIIEAFTNKFDEVWLYNVLEHTYNPRQIIENALALGKIVRIFEWINTRTNEGHPQTLTAPELNEWLKGEGKVEYVNRNGAVGLAYYGVFKGDNYE